MKAQVRREVWSAISQPTPLTPHPDSLVGSATTQRIYVPETPTPPRDPNERTQQRASQGAPPRKEAPTGPPSRTAPGATSLFGRGSWPEVSRISEVLRQETVGGALLLAATVIALVWANSPWASSYSAVRDFTFGPEFLHLNLSVSAWAADGLLAIFFFVAGLELKREFVAGDLRDRRKAALPVVAALAGMAGPALDD